jgi:hypothetical protein
MSKGVIIMFAPGGLDSPPPRSIINIKRSKNRFLLLARIRDKVLIKMMEQAGL